MNTSSKIKMFIIQKINHTYVSKDTTCFATYKMGAVKQIKIKNGTYYFYNDIIDLKIFESKNW